MTASTANEDDDFGFDQQEDQITNHPVIAHLDQLNKLAEKLLMRELKKKLQA